MSLMNRLEARLGRIESRRWLLLLVFLGIYFAGFCLVAAKGVFENDELFTLYISRLPDLQGIWKALETGAEQTPPLIYMVTRAVFGLLGISPLAFRLPELLAFAAMCVCLFYFVSKRSSPVYGFVAMLFPLMTVAFNYVTFARAYALVLGFSGIALLCWQCATDDRRRGSALAGLVISLAAAVSSHYYAVLAFFPLGLGELIRSIRRKKIDLGVWLAIILPLSPLLAYLPLIESARSFAPHFWSKPHWSSIVFYYPYFLLAPSAIPLLLILGVIFVFAAILRLDTDGGTIRVRPSIPLHEMAAVLGFLLIPAVGTVLGKTVVGAYEDRCALPAVIGLSIAVAWGVYAAFRTKRAPAFGLGLLLCLYLVGRQIQSCRREAARRANQASSYAFLEAYAKGDDPIVVSSTSGFTELTYDAPPDLGRRLLYLADPQMGLQYAGTDDVEKGLLQMKRWAGLNVEPFPSFVASGRKCYILFLSSYPNDYEWIIPALRNASWKITLVSWKEGRILFSARPAEK